jgi:hypothetical protein
MSIDRDDYEPITGSPRRETNLEKPEEGEESQEHEDNTSSDSSSTSSGSSTSPPSPDGSGEGTSGDPPVTDGDPTGPQDDSDDTSGNPSGPNGAPSSPDGSPTGTGKSSEDRQEPSSLKSERRNASREEATPSRTTGGRKRRVKVTPKDWDALERASEQLGVGYATVYRIAFRKFLSELEEGPLS